MGSDEPKVHVHQPRPVRPIEVKTYLMTCQGKLALYRNKKIYEIKKKERRNNYRLKAKQPRYSQKQNGNYNAFRRFNSSI
jgi:hypothetical protein